MEVDSKKYRAYIQILKEELIPAMGCTEPIALAYGASVAREKLGEIPTRISVEASGSIIKNVKSVIVPHTGHLVGIPAATIAGVIAGVPEAQLECIANVSDAKIIEMKEALKEIPVKVNLLDEGYEFDVIITLSKGNHYVKVRITDYHTNIVLIEKDQEILYQKELEQTEEIRTDRSILSVEDIYDFVEIVNIEDIKPILKRQIDYNMKIAEEGLTNDYGANIGKVILKMQDNTIANRAKAKAAAASDARMNGCELPVIINSGSGNQGITCSIPVIEYARHYNLSEDKLYRAIALSNLIAIHEKTGIGTLSAYCGAVSAGASAGAAIAYMQGGSFKDITHTVVNALAIVSGIICDGAKASCAAKIAASVDAGILGYQMYQCGQQFKNGDGIVVKGIENTIKNVGRLGKEGMKETNKEILNMMIEGDK